MDREKFCSLIREYEKGMYGLAMSILKNPDDAADCLQEAILKAYSKLHTLRDESKFKGWIMTIVYNCAIVLVRQRRNTAELEENGEVAAPAADISSELTVREAVAKLKLPYRTVIVLFYYEDMPVKQIAKVMKCGEANVRMQLMRGRKMLAKLLDKESFYNE